MRLYYWFVVAVIVETCARRENETSRWAFGLRFLLKDCPLTTSGQEEHRFLPVLRDCLQRRAIVALDTLLKDDVIPILDGIDLVRYNDSTSSRTNRTNEVNDTNDRENFDDWQRLFFNKLTRVFRTHVLKINLDRVPRTNGASILDGLGKSATKEDQARRRHHRRKGMFPMMMMGFMFVGSILIPMGFQFLAVLGGKALILAKMALLLSSIQGLKKIATSGVNYGFHHAPPPEVWHERSHRR